LVWANLSAWFSAVRAIGAIMVAEYAVRLWRAGAASRAIIMEPFLAIVPGRRQLGMVDAATANKRELDWPDLVHHSRPVFSGLDMNASWSPSQASASS
jgi:hypothetical protein